MSHFFASLFVREPHLRGMFPLAMDAHRDQLFAALGRYASSLDHPHGLAHWLSELALDHRKYGVTGRHYQTFCDQLLATLRAFSGERWTPAVQATWATALDYVCAVMGDATRGSQDTPAWWLAEVTGHDLRRPDLAVLTLRPDGARTFRYRPGQYVSVQAPRLPRVWREYSIANAWPLDGQLRLHVRAIPGGALSNALVHHTEVGDTIILGRARGSMTVDALTSNKVLCVAGGTGLAPVKAIIEALASAERPGPRPSIAVLLAARTREDLYDLPDLAELEQACPSLRLIPVISPESSHRGGGSVLPGVLADHLPSGPCDVVISGPAPMVRAAAAVVSQRTRHARMHLDPPAPSAVPRRRIPRQPQPWPESLA